LLQPLTVSVKLNIFSLARDNGFESKTLRLSLRLKCAALRCNELTETESFRT